MSLSCQLQTSQLQFQNHAVTLARHRARAKEPTSQQGPQLTGSGPGIPHAASGPSWLMSGQLSKREEQTEESQHLPVTGTSQGRYVHAGLSFIMQLLMHSHQIMFKLNYLFFHKRCVLRRLHLWFHAMSTVPLGADAGLHNSYFCSQCLSLKPLRNRLNKTSTNDKGCFPWLHSAHLSLASFRNHTPP